MRGPSSAWSRRSPRPRRKALALARGAVRRGLHLRARRRSRRSRSGVVIALATFIGPLAAGFVGMLIFAAIAGGLGWYGVERLRRDAVTDTPDIAAARIEVERRRARLMRHGARAAGAAQPQDPRPRAPGQGAKEKGADLAEDAVDAVTARPLAATGVVAAIAMFLAREPLIDLAGKLVDGASATSARPQERRKAQAKPRPDGDRRNDRPGRHQRRRDGSDQRSAAPARDRSL